MEKFLCGQHQAGVMAFWLGCFAEEGDFWRYIQTWYCAFDEAEYDQRYNYQPADFEQALAGVFRPEQADRPAEAFFRDAFTESFNRFKYDFAVTFDEDFLLAASRAQATTDLETLLGQWSEDLLVPLAALYPTGRLPQAANCFLALPSVRYLGPRKTVYWQSGQLSFAGNLPEKIYSDELAARYNG